MIRASRQGSVALEAALVMPGLMLILALLLGLIAAPAAETELQVALDHTAAEMALLAPLADRLPFGGMTADPDQELPADTGEPAEAMTDLLTMIPGWDDLLEDGAFDLASSVLLSPLLFRRIDQWLDLSARYQVSFQHMIGSRRLFIDLDAGQSELWICLDYELRLPGLTLPRQVMAHVPLWTGHGPASVDERDRDGIWELDNFSRGQQLRQLYHGNLPYDFPVIARWQGGEACSIKSIDLTAPTYQVPDALRRQIRRQIERLAGFQGHVYERGSRSVEIAPSDIRQRTLWLIIPENSPRESLTLLDSLSREAAAAGVSLTVRTHGRSRRYTDDGGFAD